MMLSDVSSDYFFAYLVAYAFDTIISSFSKLAGPDKVFTIFSPSNFK
jgi:hypothetical protein